MGAGRGMQVTAGTGTSSQVGFAAATDANPFGTCVGRVLQGSGTVNQFYDFSGDSLVTIQGLGSDPTSKFLVFAMLKGVSKAGTAANTYTWSGGTSTWVWNSSTFGFVNGHVYPGTMVTTG